MAMDQGLIKLGTCRTDESLQIRKWPDLEAYARALYSQQTARCFLNCWRLSERAQLASDLRSRAYHHELGFRLGTEGALALNLYRARNHLARVQSWRM